jgi:hypothetical protein
MQRFTHVGAKKIYFVFLRHFYKFLCILQAYTFFWINNRVHELEKEITALCQNQPKAYGLKAMAA